MDPRLRYSPDSSTSYLLLPSRDSVWTPDTFFRNELEAKRHRVMKDNFYVKVFPDGQVLTSDRLGCKIPHWVLVLLFQIDPDVGLSHEPAGLSLRDKHLPNPAGQL